MYGVPGYHRRCRSGAGVVVHLLIMRRYISAIVGIGVLYGLNRFCLIPATEGLLHDLLAWHGADILAGAMMLCILNVALLASRRRPLRRFGWVTLFLLGCGLFWEVITPLYLPRSVGDPRDLAAYWLGGMLLLLTERFGPRRDAF